ncbi:MAG: protease Lon-related BREX system protein BrxL [Actinomycetota bacterium]|nr:protease Lon-related BREX system protein BrxL [Actinomycetota bacterium]
MSPFDPLDRLANDAFPGRVVRKDLVRRTKVGANVPVYVLEYLLGKYCASDDPVAIEVGLAEVNRQLTEHFVWPDEAGKVQAKVKQRGKYRVIDKVKARLVESENKIWAELVNFNSRYAHIPERTWQEYDRLFESGVWAQVDLIYNETDDEPAGSRHPFWIESFRPIQVAAFDLDEYRASRSQLDRDAWIDLLIRSMGYEPAEFDTRLKLHYLARLIPLCERNFNLVELGPRGTGKSFVYRELSPNSILVSGGKTTMPQLFGYFDRRRNPGLIPVWDVVAFDEVAGLQISEPTAIQMLKDYMESGSFSRGKDEVPAEASMIYLGNTDFPPEVLVKESHLFADLPQAMIDTAFLDRLHFYLPGWEVPKMEQRFFTSHYGLVTDYLSEALRELRKHSYADAATGEFTFGPHLNARDEKAVKKTLSGFLKLLHPNGRWTRAELREYLELSMEARRRVKEQLRVLAPHEYAKTSFSYIEVDTGRELFIDTPEKPEDIDLTVAEELDAEEEQVLEHATELTLEQLAHLPESQTLEFKASMRYDLQVGGVNKALEQVVVKSVAGLMNARGGVLLIGVADNGEVVGIEKDVAMLPKRQDRDGYENHLTTLLENGIGAAATANVGTRFEEVDGKNVCRVAVKPSSSPVWTKVKGQEDVFYVRLGNSTRPLGPREAYEYISQHFR